VDVAARPQLLDRAAGGCQRLGIFDAFVALGVELSS
jgi:hypothetical protein